MNDDKTIWGQFMNKTVDQDQMFGYFEGLGLHYSH